MSIAEGRRLSLPQGVIPLEASAEALKALKRQKPTMSPKRAYFRPSRRRSDDGSRGIRAHEGLHDPTSDLPLRNAATPGEILSGDD